MKTKIYIALIVFFTLSNACIKNVYVNFTDEEQALFVYEEGDQLSFLREPQNDTILFYIVSKEIVHENTYGYMTIRDYYAHVCSTKFEGGDYKGEIIFMKDNVYSVQAWVKIDAGDNFLFSGGLGFESDSLSKIDKLHYIGNNWFGNDTLVYSKEKGIVYFNASFTNEVFTLLE